MFSKTQTKQLLAFLHGFHHAVTLLEEVTDKSVKKASLQLLYADKQAVDSGKIEPITLALSTPGGSVDAAYNLKDLIAGLHCPVHGLVIDNTSSMGVDILQMCAHRMMYPNAWLFCHFTRRNYDFIFRNRNVSAQEVQAIMEALSTDHEERIKLYRSRTGMSKKQVETLFASGEDFKERIGAKKALAMKLIDEIKEPVKILPPPRTRK